MPLVAVCSASLVTAAVSNGKINTNLWLPPNYFTAHEVARSRSVEGAEQIKGAGEMARCSCQIS